MGKKRVQGSTEKHRYNRKTNQTLINITVVTC